jgi:hypothetical protein
LGEGTFAMKTELTGKREGKFQVSQCILCKKKKRGCGQGLDTFEQYSSFFHSAVLRSFIKYLR